MTRALLALADARSGRRRLPARADALVARRQVAGLHGRGPADRPDPPARLDLRAADRRPPTPAPRPGRRRRYRLWATRADTGASVLLEESTGPLTAPGWSPDGRALAFGRVVAEADGHGPVRGRDPRRAGAAAGRLEPAAARVGAEAAGCPARRSPGAPTADTWPSRSSARAAWRSSGPTTAGRSTRSTTPSSPPGRPTAPGWPSTSGGPATRSNCLDSPLGQPRTPGRGRPGRARPRPGPATA